VLFASQAAIVLANAQAYWDARELSSGLSEAMKHRAVIEQAKGMLMAAQGCDEDAAFQLLISASQRENVKLREVALRIVQDAVNRGAREEPVVGPDDER
jgi:AmiR/NasT family two-component response regulator